MNWWNKKGKELLEEINSTRLPENMVAMWYIGQCGFVLKHGDCIIYIDPVLNDICNEQGTVRNYEIPFMPSAVKADYVFCTHGHIDHFAKDTVVGILTANPQAKLIVPKGCEALAQRYGISQENVVAVNPNDSIKLNGYTLQTFSAAHPTHVFEENSEDMALCYEIELGNIKVLHLGDTYLTDSLYQSLKNVNDLDVLLPPINGGDFFRTTDHIIGNMEAEEAAKLAVALEANVTIPTHFDMIQGNTVNPRRFMEKMDELDRSRKYHILTLGERFIYMK